MKHSMRGHMASQHRKAHVDLEADHSVSLATHHGGAGRIITEVRESVMARSDDDIDIAVQRMNAIFRKYNLSPQTNITWKTIQKLLLDFFSICASPVTTAPSRWSN